MKRIDPYTIPSCRNRKYPASRIMCTGLFGLALLVALPSLLFGQKENKLLRGGNRQYEDGKYKDAETSYRKALELNKESATGQFNLGDAIYQQKNYEEASKIFGSLAGSEKADEVMKSRAYHNLGNSLLEGKKYEESIQAFKKSLIHNPSDPDTKYNLEYARKMLQKQQQQNQQNQQNKDQQNKDQQNKDQQKDQKEQQDQQDKQKQDQNQKNEKKDQQDQKQKISKEDAERMLEALKNDERKTLQKVKKQKAKVQTIIIEKDW